MATYTVFGQPSSPATLASDPADYCMGMQFTLSQDASLTGIWFYSPSGAGGLPEQCGVYQVTGPGTGTLAASQTSPAWSGIAGSGWIKATFDGGTTLTASTSYKVAVAWGFGVNHYGATAHYWDSGPGSGGITSGPITAVNNATADGGQDTFTSGSAGVLTYPATSFNAGNYWVDVQVTIAGPASEQGLLLATFP